MITYERDIAKILTTYGHDQLVFKYIEDVVSPKQFNKIKNYKILQNTVVSDSIVIIEIPPNSTALIEKTHNYSWMSYVHLIEIENQKYSINDLEKKSEKIKYDYIYKIK